LLQTFVPQSKELQRYVDVFYIYKSVQPVTVTYLAFPHVNTGISFFKGVSITRNNFTITITEDGPAENICMEILGKYTRPVLVNFNGAFEEVAVIFKPLGVNRFIKESLQQLAPAYSQSFTDSTWAAFGETLFNAANKIEQLESFLLAQLTHHEVFTAIENSLVYFNATEADYSLGQIANSLGMNLKTFQRHFTKHMACPPAQYKRIARFRNALHSGIKENHLKSLTRISYDNNYFDQSYFIKEFKKLTHLNPKKFFRQVSVVEDDKIIWEIK
jgi:AraC-like DNA-binding protein